MSAFKITFKRQIGEDYQTRLIDAEDVATATKKLGNYWTIRSIGVQCAAETAIGNPCQVFSGNELCHRHENTDPWTRME